MGKMQPDGPFHDTHAPPRTLRFVRVLLVVAAHANSLRGLVGTVLLVIADVFVHRAQARAIWHLDGKGS